jgi:hypothetical protein
VATCLEEHDSIASKRRPVSDFHAESLVSRDCVAIISLLCLGGIRIAKFVLPLTCGFFDLLAIFVVPVVEVVIADLAYAITGLSTYIEKCVGAFSDSMCLLRYYMRRSATKSCVKVRGGFKSSTMPMKAPITKIGILALFNHTTLL